MIEYCANGIELCKRDFPELVEKISVSECGSHLRIRFPNILMKPDSKFVQKVFKFVCEPTIRFFVNHTFEYIDHKDVVSNVLFTEHPPIMDDSIYTLSSTLKEVGWTLVCVDKLNASIYTKLSCLDKTPISKPICTFRYISYWMDPKMNILGEGYVLFLVKMQGWDYTYILYKDDVLLEFILDESIIGVCSDANYQFICHSRTKNYILNDENIIIVSNTCETICSITCEMLNKTSSTSNKTNIIPSMIIHLC